MRPKMYECGHTVCELCMMRTDVAAATETALNTLPLFRCPVCRFGTYIPSPQRPLNHALCHMVECHKGYDERLAQANQDLKEWHEENAKNDEASHTSAMLGISALGGEEEQEETTAASQHGKNSPQPPRNLASVCNTVRHRNALTLFRQIFPSVQAAARRGASRLIITTRARELAEVSTELASMFFPYGVHSVNAHPREFSINILKEEGRFGNWGGMGEFINSDYVEPTAPLYPAEDDPSPPAAEDDSALEVDF